ncbi:MAG: hypothetical protein ACYC4K_10540 [Thiobacillus sp.]
MLAQQWRIAVQNETGAALGASDTIEVSGQGWSFSSTGVATYGASTIILPATSGNALAAGASFDGTAQTANTFLGFKGTVNATLSITPAGNLNFFYQEYDATLGWPGDGEGRPVGNMYCTVTGTQTAINLSF